MILPREFYNNETQLVAVSLLGKRLVRTINDITLSGIIQETEAYGHHDDPDSHAHNGRTNRNSPMFEEVGRVYVYFIYGMHYCFNVVCRAPDVMAGAVLVRSIKPERGISHMMANRKRDTVVGLSDGPAKLTQSLHITTEQNNEDLTTYGIIHIEDTDITPQIIMRKSRVGVKSTIDWNFSCSF
ncbi:MAG: DNA-3-methyladenine glycosylase [Cenarchaeum sp. SB0665_bin_23]|nr:DNA-3-methyladenine glycosylase [Cenarchaeum sp. SB0667_bin_13]MXY61554.1 DNA-3-methyladenine glycosylase [Cenarchaeum sp. SB0665_bin_23]MXZ94064.1 DNA-3-methyladenine glycosylase [Cenarchaeum sp. SB0666_bin_15]MYC79722.1 DNA-3-methyladenine glycosylase [Cenarchaeum sp. SB0661_bin_35]MYG32712.1 DNA-3-methyladenine glycosylase [Cenarchaeum sp. SB0677_bin_16]MYI51754.1 DNA-3-methyladenine glycosylase [Cenarchaeum sp. SB0673_bin_9]MYJ28132.1 DNA-3-methyladenine glycosylase [Cenarchaeum sp. SB